MILSRLKAREVGKVVRRIWFMFGLGGKWNSFLSKNRLKAEAMNAIVAFLRFWNAKNNVGVKTNHGKRWAFVNDVNLKISLDKVSVKF